MAAVVAAGLVGAAAYASQDTTGQPHRTQEDLELDWEARSSGVQVLGGTRDPGIPSVQRIRHDNVYFTVTIAPARPGPNLVRIDVAQVRGGAHTAHRNQKVYVGTSADFDSGHQVWPNSVPARAGCGRSSTCPRAAERCCSPMVAGTGSRSRWTPATRQHQPPSLAPTARSA